MKRYASGNPIGEEHRNPVLDVRLYELEFSDGRVDEYAVNIIIDNIITLIGDQGWDTDILEDIVDLRFDPDVAIQTGEQAYTNFNLIQRPVITTKG